VRRYLAEHGDRIVLHYLPARSPQDNPIERVWWHLHEQITRNHQCQCIEELIDLTLAWLEERGAFQDRGPNVRKAQGRGVRHFRYSEELFSGG
jgi:transposase